MTVAAAAKIHSASMRPEHEAPENDSASLRMQPCGMASMRPEHEAPENTLRISVGYEPTGCFNEAGARGSGELFTTQ